jgi:penicillin-binding protein 1C
MKILHLFYKKRKFKVFLILFFAFLIFYIFCLPKDLFRTPYSTVVYARGGELLGARIATDGQWRFPSCDTVPDKFEKCIVTFEDKNFRKHWGVNPLAIGRAIVQNVRNKEVVSGGSTITMQVVRMSRNKGRTIFEKCYESILATRLEFRYSKDKILALYASHAPFGGNIVGLDAAAWRYFGHSATQLSWAEAATLAVLPNAPSSMHLSKNRQKLLEKRNRLLKKLYENDSFDETTYVLALAEELPAEPIPLPVIAPHLVSQFYKNQQGKQINSTIDKNLQERVEDILDRWNRVFLQNDIKNLAAIVIDVETNEAIVYCGNVNFAKGNAGNQVDVIQAQRSTGSILKPFLYHAILQEGEILPNTLIADIPLNINGFSPENFNKKFFGAVPASQAVSRSLNVPLVLMLKKHSVPKFHNFLKNNNVAALPRASTHYGLSLILGGAESCLLDVTTAYSNMARTILDKESIFCRFYTDEIEKNIPSASFEKGAVWQVFEAIKEVNRPEDIDWHNIPTMQKIAWKTGTSFGFRDAWAVGVTPRYAVGVWVGNASGEGKSGLVGARTAGPVMFDIFETLPKSSWFEAPMNEFVEAEICHKSGYLRGRFCDEIDTIPILPVGLRTESCPFHTHVTLSTDERFRLFADCTDENVIQKSWFTLPPAWEFYYKQYNADYRSLPPYGKGCGNSQQNPMQFIYPTDNNSVVILPKQLSGEQGEITFNLAHNRRDATVFWHINSEYVGATNDFHSLTLALLPDDYHIMVVDDEGNNLSIKVKVK